MNNWIEVTIKTTTEAVEPITNILYEQGAGGAVIEDPKDFLFQKKNELDWDYVEEEVFKKNEEDGVLIKTYVSEEKNVMEFVEIIKQKVLGLRDFGIDIGEGSVSLDQVNEADWANAWKAYYKPTKVGQKVVVKPTWEDYDMQEGDLIIELDPGMAFGTGTHETTSMCIRELEKYVNKDSKVFDIGCGSGILAIAAAKLGAKEVVAVDLDEVAVKVAKENVLENKVEENVSVMHGNLTDVIKDKADVVVANIIADIIKILAKDVQNFMKEDAIFISSGIILDKVEEVKESLIENGFEIVEVQKLGEWSAIVSKLKK
ncbi:MULTISPECIES: 50S ribosomal protein L11 methyltransferase [unclassified Clostridioides]|uniref:50S ribosomal protein L11 methyltransferase n=1 Tax=unclassified Clostridioides TaxID=2635829 RepID=UPI001D0C563C|nr:50S ribosomal protein L11 methyltransferase [Clostridioides sp. ES-S-0001-02]MCC0639172.1 50S ribosomal protein L11 methyltransferase [Clostridioides sp. ES-S-0049-03]MCC0657099.1 50S ribosomal protein L11 methyltransferase [Clostridioides sp. ES-S-0123-01]MCC0672513.1 50S ribosomal protein L11 methyltransferase [Clostridioides sp. ES-S-0145-01]MCC0675562.1 50S ribosomal protein L11 methyltransferase [Clostridioides sp. ES-W-0018-02]MCC0680181.1 50S ribosomal protein L11 methyltransferase [